MKTKKHWLKKILSVSFCAAVLGAGAAFLPAVIPGMGQAQEAAAYSYYYNGDFEFVGGDEYDIVILSGYDGSSSTINIPSSVNGYIVTAISENVFRYNDYIQNVTIPNTVIKIYDKAFYYCDNLKTVRIPSSVQEIESNVFTNSDNVKLIVDKGSYAEKYAKSNGIKYSYSSLSGIKLDRYSATLGISESITLKATASPAGASLGTLTWSSSNSSVVSVSNGRITAKKTGSANITVKTQNGKTATCKVTVKSAPSKVTITKSNLTIGAGEKYTLGSGINNGAGCATRTFRTSNSSIVKMTRTNWQGDFVGVKPGTAYVTVRTYNGKEATCKVTVKAAPTKVTITKGILEMGVGEKYTLGSGINNGSAAAQRTFRTSNNSIVKLTRTSWQGDMVAVKPGTAYVTVRIYNGKEATCKVTVKSAPGKVSLNKGAVTLGVGETYKLSAVLPSNTASAKRTFRSSNNNIVKMTKTDWEGQFKAMKVGTVYVTVRTYNGKEASCKVTVKAAPSKVSLSKTSLTLYVGDTYKLSASVPANSAAASRTFRSSNNNIVKMTKTDWEGQFKAVKAGTAYVTVRTYNGKEASCKVTVINKPAPKPTTSYSSFDRVKNLIQSKGISSNGELFIGKNINYDSGEYFTSLTYDSYENKIRIGTIFESYSAGGKVYTVITIGSDMKTASVKTNLVDSYSDDILCAATTTIYPPSYTEYTSSTFSISPGYMATTEIANLCGDTIRLTLDAASLLLKEYGYNISDLGFKYYG